MTNPDLTRIINSDEIQSVLRVADEKHQKRPFTQRKNPLTNVGVMVRLNPYAQTLKRRELLAVKSKKSKKVAPKNEKFVETLLQ